MCWEYWVIAFCIHVLSLTLLRLSPSALTSPNTEDEEKSLSICVCSPWLILKVVGIWFSWHIISPQYLVPFFHKGSIFYLVIYSSPTNFRWGWLPTPGHLSPGQACLRMPPWPEGLLQGQCAVGDQRWPVKLDCEASFRPQGSRMWKREGVGSGAAVA